jgi:hypothetical protein
VQVEVEYFIAMKATKFFGHSMSSYSGLLILERWRAGLHAAPYNSLAGMKPLYLLRGMLPVEELHAQQNRSQEL